MGKTELRGDCEQLESSRVDRRASHGERRYRLILLIWSLFTFWVFLAFCCSAGVMQLTGADVWRAIRDPASHRIVAPAQANPFDSVKMINVNKPHCAPGSYDCERFELPMNDLRKPQHDDDSGCLPTTLFRIFSQDKMGNPKYWCTGDQPDRLRVTQSFWWSTKLMINAPLSTALALALEWFYKA